MLLILLQLLHHMFLNMYIIYSIKKYWFYKWCDDCNESDNENINDIKEREREREREREKENVCL